MPKLQGAADIVDLRIARFDAIVSSKVIAQTISKNDNLYIQNGQIVELFCTAHGRPLPEINWFKDGHMVSPKSESSSFMISKFGATSSLRITNVKTSHSGTYTCRAENVNGHINKWVFVSVYPKVNITTKYSKNVNSKSKYVHKSLCEVNPCKNGTCLEKNNGSSYECKCQFPYNGNMCENNILLIGNKGNFSTLEERNMNCNKRSNITINDQLFTIFETILVCIIASLFLGILFYIFRRKYCCFFKRSKVCHHQVSQAIQAEINNFVLVRDVGINVNGQFFEHGCDKLMPVPYRRNMAMLFRETRFQEIHENLRLLPNDTSKLLSKISYEENVLANQYSNHLQTVFHNQPIPSPSIFCNTSVIQENSYDSSSEALNLTKCESEMCPCFNYNSHPLSSTLLIFNEPVSTSLSNHNPRLCIENEQANIVI